MKIYCIIFLSLITQLTAQKIEPVLEFPEPGLDDFSAYSGYKTRFYKDIDGNTVQISIDKNIGRVVNLWADAENESLSFSVKDNMENPVEISWNKMDAVNSREGSMRFVQYSLSSNSPDIKIGLFVLGSMRVERDFRYSKRYNLPLNTDTVFIQNELINLIKKLKRLPKEIRSRQLEELKAKSVEDLYKRLNPQINYYKIKAEQSAIVTQDYFDGNNHLSLEISTEDKNTSLEVNQNIIHLRSSNGNQINFSIKIGTDSPSLSPLYTKDIFNEQFLNYYEKEKSKYFRLQAKENLTKEQKDSVNNFKRMEREVKSLELLSSKEKLMAGLPNFATYFGRDMMMSALMMESIWKGSMLENVITSVLKKLRSDGNVSHEEGLGGEAIRENAAEYNSLLEKYFSSENRTEKDSLLAVSEIVLKNLDRTTENYRMIDDDFQLPVLIAHYLSHKDIPASQKINFFKSRIKREDSPTILSLLLRNLNYITDEIKGYIKNPSVLNMVSFVKSEDYWQSASWRDSRAGYANGRFAMDINAIWVPQALQSINEILSFLKGNNFSFEDLTQSNTDIKNTLLESFFDDPKELKSAENLWEGTAKYFWTQLPPDETKKKISEKLEWFPDSVSGYWEKILKNNWNENQKIKFLTLSLDENGNRINIENTDPATLIFLNDFTEQILNKEMLSDSVFNIIEVFTIPFPAGLFVENLGVLAANDTYSSNKIWEAFKSDQYHSPYVVWGREMNLIFLGLSKQILSAYNSNGKLKDDILSGYIEQLKSILQKIHAAVEKSGLKYNELWTYEIRNENLYPKRYETSSDIQLWNITNLSSEYLMNQIPK